MSVRSFDAPVTDRGHYRLRGVVLPRRRAGTQSLPQYFAAGDVVNGPLIGIAASGATPNGLYRYGSGGDFPVNSWNATNYWVDVAFEGDV